jgi:hypothetical protein
MFNCVDNSSSAGGRESGLASRGRAGLFVFLSLGGSLLLMIIETVLTRIHPDFCSLSSSSHTHPASETIFGTGILDFSLTVPIVRKMPAKAKSAWNCTDMHCAVPLGAVRCRCSRLAAYCAVCERCECELGGTSVSMSSMCITMVCPPSCCLFFFSLPCNLLFILRIYSITFRVHRMILSFLIPCLRSFPASLDRCGSIPADIVPGVACLASLFPGITCPARGEITDQQFRTQNAVWEYNTQSSGVAKKSSGRLM